MWPTSQKDCPPLVELLLRSQQDLVETDIEELQREKPQVPVDRDWVWQEVQTLFYDNAAALVTI